jgi:hypothetical protein
MLMDMNMMDFVEFWFIPTCLYSILINIIEFFFSFFYNIIKFNVPTQHFFWFISKQNRNKENITLVTMRKLFTALSPPHHYPLMTLHLPTPNSRLTMIQPTIFPKGNLGGHPN